MRSLIVALSIAVLAACGSSGSTTPTPQPTAILSLEVGDLHIRPVGDGYSSFTGGGSTLRETGGVNVTLTSWTFESPLLGRTVISCQGRLAAHGSVALGEVCRTEGGTNIFWTGQDVYLGIVAEFLSHTVVGVDDNGHNVSVSASGRLFVAQPDSNTR